MIIGISSTIMVIHEAWHGDMPMLVCAPLKCFTWIQSSKHFLKVNYFDNHLAWNCNIFNIERMLSLA